MYKKLTCFVLLIVFLGGCSNQAENNLKESLAQYKKYFNEKDFISLSSLVLPSTVEKLGGVEAFVETMKSIPAFLEQQGMTMDISKLEFGDPSKIVVQDEYSISVISTKQPVVVQEISGLVESSVIAFSEDNGNTWFFLEGSDEGKMAIANESPAILQKITIPTPKMTLGDIVLLQKNGQWIRQ